MGRIQQRLVAPRVLGLRNGAVGELRYIGAVFRAKRSDALNVGCSGHTEHLRHCGSKWRAAAFLIVRGFTYLIAYQMAEEITKFSDDRLKSRRLRGLIIVDGRFQFQGIPHPVEISNHTGDLTDIT